MLEGYIGYSDSQREKSTFKRIYHLFWLLTNNFDERDGILMKGKSYYENLFANYPDVVTLEQFRKMLGGIGDGTARKLMRENHVRHYYIRTTYLIPKVWVIEYILSDHYAEYKDKLKVQV